MTGRRNQQVLGIAVVTTILLIKLMILAAIFGWI